MKGKKAKPQDMFARASSGFYFRGQTGECASFNSNTKQTPAQQRACVQAMTQLVLDKESGGAVAKMKRAFRGQRS